MSASRRFGDMSIPAMLTSAPLDAASRERTHVDPTPASRSCTAKEAARSAAGKRERNTGGEANERGAVSDRNPLLRSVDAAERTRHPEHSGTRSGKSRRGSYACITGPSSHDGRRCPPRSRHPGVRSPAPGAVGTGCFHPNRGRSNPPTSGGSARRRSHIRGSRRRRPPASSPLPRNRSSGRSDPIVAGSSSSRPRLVTPATTDAGPGR